MWSCDIVSYDDNEENSYDYNNDRNNFPYYEEESLKLSSILSGNSEGEINKFKKFLFPDKTFYFDLKYKMTRDGKSFKDFHEICDNIAPNLLLIKDNKDNIFGGFTNVSWESAEVKKQDLDSFLFSVTKNKKYYPKNLFGFQIFCFPFSGPRFCSGNIGFQGSDMSYCMSTRKGEYLDNSSLSTNESGFDFSVKEVEFYKIFF